MNLPMKGSTAGNPGEKELDRQLIEQFFEASRDRYGKDSEQARAFAMHLRGSHSGQPRRKIRENNRDR